MMRKLLFPVMSFLLLFVLLLPQATQAAAANTGIQLFLNGKKLNPEVPPVKIGDYSMVPVRVITEGLGAKVEWNGKLKMVTIKKSDTVIQLVINQKYAVVNAKVVPLDAAPALISGNTLLPARFVAENLGLNVEWRNDTQSVLFTLKPDKPVPTTPVGNDNSSPAPIVLPTDQDNNGGKPPVAAQQQVISMAGAVDQLVIQTTGKVEAKIFPLSNPDRLVIDLPQTSFGPGIAVPSAGQMGGIYNVNPWITQIRYAMNAPETSTIRVVMEFKGNTHYDILSSGADGKVIVAVKPDTRKFKVVIDAGHGDQDPGANSVTGKKEKDFNLSMALKVNALLQQEPAIQPYLTRSDDTFLPLDTRADIANNMNADVFVSIHANAWMASANGTQTYYYNGYSRNLADIIHKHLVAATGFRDDKVRQEDFRVIHRTNMPGVLLEVGYLTNAVEESQLFTQGFQDRVAAAIVAGIKEYLNIK